VLATRQTCIATTFLTAAAGSKNITAKKIFVSNRRNLGAVT
jgi:hypothetical protein